MRFICFLFLFVFYIGSIVSETIFPQIKYQVVNEPLDVVIPSTTKDLETLNLCIQGIRENGINVRRIIVVSKERLTHEAEWFDEKNYPFNKKDIARQIFQDKAKAKSYLASTRNRIGWIYQQFLKLYAPYVIPGISSNVLILDSDTIFLTPTEFLDEEGNALFNTSGEYHEPYFAHMDRVFSGFGRVYPKASGICHHMVFQKAVLDDLFTLIRKKHKKTPWKSLCRCIDLNELDGSCLSEYEIYFNFVFSTTNQMQIRPLKMLNTGDFTHLRELKKQGYNYVSCHTYLRR